MHVFHKWSRWGELFEEEWFLWNREKQTKVPYTKLVQEKECKECGAIKRRIVQGLE